MSATAAIGPQAAHFEDVLEASQHLTPSDLHQLTQLGMQLQDEDAVAAFGRAATALEAAGREEALGEVLDRMQNLCHYVAEELLPEWFDSEKIRSWGRADALQKLTAPLSAAGVVAALAARNLVDEDGFNTEDYRMLIGAWRTVIAPAHAHDTEGAPRASRCPNGCRHASTRPRRIDCLPMSGCTRWR